MTPRGALTTLRAPSSPALWQLLMTRPILFTLATFALLCALSPEASAQIYRYELDDGSVIYTTEPREGADPIEVIGEVEPEAPARRVAPPSRPNPNPDRAQDAFDSIIRRASTAYNIPFEFIKAVIRVESAFDPHAVSHAGAMGLMQLMPGTAEYLNCGDAFDPDENIMAGTQYLRLLTDRYNGDINLVLSAYNAGPGAVGQYDGIPYEATRRYVERVFQYYLEYLGETESN